MKYAKAVVSSQSSKFGQNYKHVVSTEKTALLVINTCNGLR